MITHSRLTVPSRKELILAVPAAVASGALIATDPVHVTPTVLVCVIGVVLIAPLVYRLATRTFDPFEPIVWFVLAWGAMFVARPAAMIHNQDIIYQDSWRVIDLTPTFGDSLTLGLVGAVSFIVAYGSPLGYLFARKCREAPVDATWDMLIPGAVITGAVGLVLGVIWLHTAGKSPLSLFVGRAARTSRELLQIQNGSSYLLHGPYLLIPAAIVLLTAGWSRRDFVVTSLGAGFATVAILRALALGDRFMLLPMVGGLFIFWYLRRGRRPSLLGFVATIVVFLYVATVIGQTRTADYRAQHSTLQAAEQTLTDPSQVLATITHSTDSSEVPILAGAMLYVPKDVPFQYGNATVGDLVTRPIPRAMWPGKPLPPAQQVFEHMMPEAFAAGSSNKAGSSLLVFYMDAGLVGVILGMALYGILARTVYEYYNRWSDRIFAQLVLALFTTLMANMVRDGFADTVERAVLILGPVWLIYRLAGRTRAGRVAVTS